MSVSARELLNGEKLGVILPLADHERILVDAGRRPAVVLAVRPRSHRGVPQWRNSRPRRARSVFG